MLEIFMISQLMTKLNNMMKAIQLIIFTGKTSQASVIYYIYEKSKETILEFSKGTTKVL